MKMQRFWVGRALLLAVAVLYAGGYVRTRGKGYPDPDP